MPFPPNDRRLLRDLVKRIADLAMELAEESAP